VFGSVSQPFSGQMQIFLEEQQDFQQDFTDKNKIVQRATLRAADLMNTGDFEGARTFLAWSVKQRSDFAEAWVPLGKCCVKLGDYKEAQSAYETALKIHSERYDRQPNSNDLLQQAYILLLLGRETDSQRLLEEAKEKYSDDQQVKLFSEAGFDALKEDSSYCLPVGNPGQVEGANGTVEQLNSRAGEDFQKPAVQVEGEGGKVEQENSGAGEQSRLISSRKVQWIDVENGEVLFDIDDIVRFDWEKQIFELTRSSAMDFMAELGTVGVQGRKFIVRDGQTIYEGTLVTPFSSFSFHGPVIKSTLPDDRIEPPLFRIDGGYPTDFEKGDTRFSERLKKALEQVGVLGEIDSHLRNVKFRIIDEATGEPLSNRELNICKFVYFKLKPGAASPYLDKKADWYINSVTADDKGWFVLDLSSIDTTDIVIEPGGPYNIVKFERSLDLRHTKSKDYIRVVQFKPGTTQVVSNMIYDLKRKMVRIISISGETKELPFQEVLLYAKRIKKSLEKPAEQVEAEKNER
jgi:hypothetical protein